MISLLDSNHQKKLMKKWAPFLEAGKTIENDYTKLALAQVLESTAAEFKRHGMLNEAVAGEGPNNGLHQADLVGAGRFEPGKSNGVMTGAFGMPSTDRGQYGDFYLPNVVMPILRRIFPDLIANELVGVQPLNGPIGFALALRAKYNQNGWVANGDDKTSTEIGYAPTDTEYTGISTGLSDELSDNMGKKVDETAWEFYAGSNKWAGAGAPLGNSEYASLANGTYPTVSFDLIKAGVEAKTRKLGAHWSPELAEDMEAMHGIDVEAEMVNILSYEIGAEIDRQIISEMVKAAITGGSITSWSPVSADGLDQMGRLATLLTQITIEANQIALRTKRGNGNFVVTTPRICAILEQMAMNKYVSMGGAKSIPSVPYSGVGAIQKQGLINDGNQLLIRDAYAPGNKDYILVGYKGQHPGDSGIIYCPYIPVQLSKVLRPDTFTPAVGARTRYGVMNSPWDAGRYYAFIKVEGLTTGYSFSSDKRTFIAPTSTVKY